MANFILFAELTLQSAPHWDSPMEDSLTVSPVYMTVVCYMLHTSRSLWH
jgi:hypothetical protein